MVDKLLISKLNEVYIHVDCEPSILYELNDYFSFLVPNYWFMPAYKNKMWDGKIRLFNVNNKNIYAGLQQHIAEFCQKRGYEIEYNYDTSSVEFSIKEAQSFIKTLKLPFELHSHQEKAFIHAIREKRALILSPVGSGKSLLVYILTKYYNTKTLIIVPTINLVSQMYSDFMEYGMNEKNIHKVYAGQEKNTDKQVLIGTWQSIFRLSEKWFEQFNVVIIDEADQADTKSLTSIMINLKKCIYRFGVTGTLTGTKTNQLVLEGLFGKLKTVATTTELIDKEILSNLNIKSIVLNYPIEERKSIRKYKDEINYIISSSARIRFIKNLALSLEGNSLILFQFIKHGKELYEKILEEANDRPVFFVWGDIKGDERDDIRKIVETEKNAIILASSVFIRGVNIKSLQHLIFSSPSKARRRVLQAIGRTLRKSEVKTKAIVYDIVDDLSYKKKKNYALEHYLERAQIYREENFKVKCYTVELKGENK